MTPEHGLDSNFRYVVMAARRARQLQNGSQPLIDSRSTKACRVAQEEIAAGMVKAAAHPRIDRVDEVPQDSEHEGLDTGQDRDS